jgi:replication-associated recombination protein RarA
MTYLTKRGYALLDVASALQKSIRRGDAKLAGYMAQELVASGYVEYVWKRLLTISAEDCHGIITQEIKSLHESFQFINKGKKELKGRIFVSKAVLIMAHALKSRDADHLQCLMYDQKLGISDEEIEDAIMDADLSEKIELPEYTYDVHTRKGRMSGKTKEQFFREEQQGLSPKAPGLFDNLI